ncbi:hypothetical protein U4960_05620 [Altererythrobacter sp. H2]|uniref:hypothetical protein n=1 Tax=Altererythrobacter sp. H2 TaxID=3108391 RepID=UPI002B4BAB2E|nr:hypothetical protein [Altererythrobacter sp. H2]WRK96797.1 hypothetical protein U4960_05620 [Altererythrobacter sp. H2]
MNGGGWRTMWAARRDPALIPIGLVFALAFALQVELVINRPVNWDEFFHLTEAHAFAQGRLTEVLQVLYARAFGWLAWLPIDAIDQIRVARVFMQACNLFTVLAICAMAARFVPPVPAALAGLAYYTGGYVFEHAFSYRADPIAAAFLMGALWILLSSRLRPLALLGAAALCGLAVLTTIKVIFYAPAFAGIFWLRLVEAEDRKAMMLRLAAFVLAALAFAALFLGLTMLTLPSGAAAAGKTLHTSGTMMFNEGLFPRWPYIFKAMALAPVLGLAVLAAPAALIQTSADRAVKIAMIGLLLPLLSIAFYRNSFPYYYVFILPPVVVGTAWSFQQLLTQFPLRLVAAALAVNAALLSFATPRAVLPVQHQVVAAVHEIFPEPVAYFDFPGMIVDYPKANFFMTTWGFHKYWRGYEPSFSDAMASQTVPMMVVNHQILADNHTKAGGAPELRPEDRIALREGFIPHWGPIWVAGKSFGAEATDVTFRIHAPGFYTLEGGSARINGQTVVAGQTIRLGRGQHRLERSGQGTIRLRWGRNLRRPAYPFAGEPIFKDF